MAYTGKCGREENACLAELLREEARYKTALDAYLENKTSSLILEGGGELAYSQLSFILQTFHFVGKKCFIAALPPSSMARLQKHLG